MKSYKATSCSVKHITYNDHRDTYGEKSYRFTLHATHGQLSVHEPHEGVDSHENHAGRCRHLFRHSEEEGEDRERADVDTAAQ